MIELLIVSVYAFVIMHQKITPVFSSLVWINKNIFSRFFSGMNKLFRKRIKQQEIIQDAFDVPVKNKKANTIAQKLADKGGDDISKLITEIGKIFIDIDARIKYFFIGLINIFFITGTIYHILWAITYWRITLIVVVLFIEFITWAKATAKPKTK